MNGDIIIGGSTCRDNGCLLTDTVFLLVDHAVENASHVGAKSTNEMEMNAAIIVALLKPLFVQSLSKLYVDGTNVDRD